MIYRVKSSGATYATFEAAKLDLAESHLRVYREDDHTPAQGPALRYWTAFDDATGYPCDKLEQFASHEATGQ